MNRQQIIEQNEKLQAIEVDSLDCYELEEEEFLIQQRHPILDMARRYDHTVHWERWRPVQEVLQYYSFRDKEFDPYCAQGAEISMFSGVRLSGRVWKMICQRRMEGILVVYHPIEDFFYKSELNMSTMSLESAIFQGVERGRLKTLRDYLSREPIKVVAVERQEKRREEIWIAPVFLGPRWQDVRTFSGNQASVTSTYDLGSKVYRICTRISGEELNVEGEVKEFLFLRHLRMSKIQDYFSRGYYEQESYYYSWSYAQHSRVMDPIFQQMSSDQWVVAPGDSTGVVARRWQNTISGDFVLTSMSHPSTLQETFQETMERGRRKKDSVLVLAYVWNIMKQQDQDSVRKWPGQVYVIDTKCSLDPVAPGLWGINISVPLGVSFLEKNIDSALWYTENLLSIESPIFDGPSVYRSYFERMRPMALKGSTPVFAHVNTLNWRPFYFCPIGKHAEFRPFFLKAMNFVKFRAIYFCPNTPRYDFIRQLPNQETATTLFFWLTGPTTLTLPSGSISFQEGSDFKWCDVQTRGSAQYARFYWEWDCEFQITESFVKSLSWFRQEETMSEYLKKVGVTPEPGGSVVNWKWPDPPPKVRPTRQMRSCRAQKIRFFRCQGSWKGSSLCRSITVWSGVHLTKGDVKKELDHITTFISAMI